MLLTMITIVIVILITKVCNVITKCIVMTITKVCNVITKFIVMLITKVCNVNYHDYKCNCNADNKSL
jgi:hypothetical protein